MVENQQAHIMISWVSIRDLVSRWIWHNHRNLSWFYKSCTL